MMDSTKRVVRKKQFLNVDGADAVDGERCSMIADVTPHLPPYASQYRDLMLHQISLENNGNNHLKVVRGDGNK